MAIEVKEGGPVDPGELKVLYDLAPWARGRDLDGIKRMLENTDYIFPAREDGRLVGFARVLTDRIYRATLWDVVVLPEYQGKGVGDEIMRTILEHPVLSRVNKFWLNTRDKHAYYERFGFKRSDQGMVLEKVKEQGP